MKSVFAIVCLCFACGAAGAAPRSGTASVFIEDLAWPEVRDAIAAGAGTAIYYAGSTEQNGPHMATGKHNFIARYVAERIARTLGNALVYPIMPFAPTGDAGGIAAAPTGHMRFPGSVSLSEETFAAVARDVALSARASGFKHIVLMGDHGGGQKVLDQVAAELDAQWAPRGVRVHYVGDLYFATQKRIGEYLARRGMTAGGHAGIPDTSELMFVDKAGKWIRRGKLGGRGDRDESGVDGDPRSASAALGKVFVEFKIEAAVSRIRQLAGEASRNSP